MNIKDRDSDELAISLSEFLKYFFHLRRLVDPNNFDRHTASNCRTSWLGA